jgi:hypothetical protein
LLDTSRSFYGNLSWWMALLTLAGAKRTLIGAKVAVNPRSPAR